jgi:hypothetical protein
MPAYIRKDFDPSDKTYDFLKAKHQIPREFLDEYVTEHFTNYWNELKDEHNHKGQKEAWQSTYINWSKSAWRGRLGRIWEEHRHDRNGYGKSKPNLFQETLGDMITEGTEGPKKPKPTYRLPDPPADTGERMSTDEALDKLHAMFPGKS